MLSSRKAEEIDVRVLADGPLPEGLVIEIIDLEQQVRVSLRGTGDRLEGLHILSRGADKPYRLKLLAGTPEFVAARGGLLAQVPRRTVLDQNAPNPFNATTRIRFGLPKTERVTFTLYNVRGARVRSLVRLKEMSAGYHTLIWRGRNDHGRTVASGIYFGRLSAGGTILTQRLVLLK